MDTPNVSDRPDERIASECGECGEYGALDPFTDEHDIEYWLWDGAHLIPASAEKSERLREREALLRLSYWQAFMEKHDHARPPLVSGAPVEEASGVIMPSLSESLPHTRPTSSVAQLVARLWPWLIVAALFAGIIVLGILAQLVVGGR